MSRIRFVFASIIIATVILLTGAASAQTDYPAVAQLTASDGVAGSGLGGVVAASGNTVVIGEFCGAGPSGANYCNPDVQLGAVYVYQKPADGWQSMVQVAKLTPSNAYAGDRFGFSVAISGGTIVVGAGEGTAYVFVQPASGNWTNMTETAQLKDGAEMNPISGPRVAVDGDTIVLSEGGALVDGVEQGAAFVFTKPPGGWASTKAFNAELTASDQGVGFGGSSVAVSGDTIVVGEPTAYVFVKPSAGWKNATQTAILTRSYPRIFDGLGVAVAIYGDVIAVGFSGANSGSGGAVDVYQMPSTGWANMTETAELLAPTEINVQQDVGGAGSFGTAVAIDSSRIVVGDGGGNKAIFVYSMPQTGGWKSSSLPDATLVDGLSNLFGDAVCIVNEAIIGGNWLQSIGGNSAQGAAYVFEPAPATSFSTDFSSASGLTLNGSAALSGSLQLTDGALDQAGSAFYAIPVNIQSFTTDFTFLLTNAHADGFTFTIQNAGPTALGANGGNLGYAGIPNSQAIKFDLYSNSGEGTNSTGIYANGVSPIVPAIDLTGSGINLHSGDKMEAHITYQGSTLVLTLTDLTTHATWSHLFIVDIPATVGSSTAYIGFTGATGGLGATQQILTWSYESQIQPYYGAGFSPASGLEWNGSAALTGGSLELTDGGLGEAGSAYYATPVNIQAFSTDFNFQLTNAAADGFTFTIQNAGPTALGGHGGGLGYAGIHDSVAIKFDLYNNAGEGSDSIGIYVDGKAPILPAIDLTSTTINLHSGHAMDVYITYDGTTLTLTLTDLVTLAFWPHSFTIDIPAAVGGPTAYVGFTAATGGESAIQQILAWSFQ